MVYGPSHHDVLTTLRVSFKLLDRGDVNRKAGSAGRQAPGAEQTEFLRNHQAIVRSKEDLVLIFYVN